jgi:hypothetical protein
MWDKYYEEKVKFLKGGRNSNQGPRLPHEINQRLLSLNVLKVISRDLGVRITQNIPRWKGISMRKMME